MRHFSFREEMASVGTLLLSHLLFLFINTITAFKVSPLDPYLANSFPDTPTVALKHFTVSANRSIYIGGVDSLYHLSQNFDVQSQVEFNDEGERNVNKILAIIPSPIDELISCGTGLNGTCQLRKLDDISQGEIYLPHLKLAIAPENDTTVGLVVGEARGRISLYVAQTVNAKDLDITPIRSISSICLHSKDENGCRLTFTLGSDRATRIIGSGVEPDFIIRYVAVLSYQGYTYYVASQRKSAKDSHSPIVPKISRVCHNDTTEDLSGFTEITLECKGEDGILYSIPKSAVEFNGSLYIVFVRNVPVNGFNFNETNQSALCMYKMESLRTEFGYSAVNCSCMAESWSSSNYLSNSMCAKMVNCDLVKPFTCSPLSNFGSKYPERKDSLGALPGLLIFELSGASFSSVLVAQIDQPVTRRVAFIGTGEGTLIKVYFDADNTSSAVQYETVEMAHPVLRDTWINAEGGTAMFLTEKQLLEITLANCSQYQTCEECIQPGLDGGDPYCGWCTLEKRCTRYENCTNNNASSRWLWYNEKECSAINNVTPRNLSIKVQSQMVAIEVSHLPDPNEFKYVCHFGPIFTSEATLSDGLLSCRSPGMTAIPRIPDADEAVEVELAISSTEFNIPFVTISYAFFDCSRIRGCRDCVSKWTCDWCIDELRCVDQQNSTCYNITSLLNDASESCPQLVPGKAVVPSGVNREIIVTARNLNLTTSLFQREYECVIRAADEENIPDTFVSNASVTTSYSEYNVTCSRTQHSYLWERQEVRMFLSLRWKSTSVFLDGVYNVTLYKCNVNRPDCSRCLSDITTLPEYECGWCDATQGFCAVEENCSSSLLRECRDPPQITSVTPTSSPIGGGTVVEIRGTDLGQRFSDIINVSLAGVLCRHQNYSENYQVGASLTCLSGDPQEERQGRILVHLTNGKEAEYKTENFSYTDPQISSFDPILGPKSGGTLITIIGTHLRTGRDIGVTVGERTCEITEHNSTNIVCLNEGFPGEESFGENVSVSFDLSERLATEKFAYRPDPVVFELTPESTIRSGGNLLTVTGERFNLIQEPKIQFTVNGSSAEERCSHQNENGTEIECKSPSVAALLEQRRRRRDNSEAEGKVAVGFIMDGVTGLLDWSQNKSVVFQYFRDPQYETFDVLNHQEMTDNFLTLNGKDLNLASTIEDVSVSVGTGICVVKSLGPNTLICELPKEQPEPGDIDCNKTSNGLPCIIVHHANLEFRIGFIRYTDPSRIVQIVILALCVIAVVIVIGLPIIVCYIRRKKTKKIRDLELQVLNIQESVSDNLKALFATLQTTLHDFETAIEEQTKIPLLERKQYLLNMMFLGQNVKPSESLPKGTVINAKTSVAMEEFSKVLYHKSFLKVLIKALDKATNISAMDRVNAGSLLSVCLLQSRNLELYTDLLLSIMQENIQESDSKRKQRSLFRGNDTMLEKLIANWFTIFLYGFLKEQAASKVYRLYEAIKYVCEMGPIDAVSGKSQFSINDQEMLETQIDFNEVNIEVISDSDNGETKPLKVLDVNTVTQVKERIISHNYRHVPYSQRPSPFMVDLMWRAGRSGQLILRDDENLPGTLDKEWKRVCTLQDMKVQSGAKFELVSKQDNPNAEIVSNGRLELEGTDDYSRNIYYLEGPERVNAAWNSGTVESQRKTYDVEVSDGLKVWHLIKEDQEDLLADDGNKETRSNKEIREVVLPFLPATRNNIQKYVDGLFDAIFAANHGADVPLSVKYLFQFFDREAETEGKPGLAKAWKNNVSSSVVVRSSEEFVEWNGLPLRYWTTIVANPQYVLDVGVYTYTHASLRILVQIIKDTCDGREKEYKNQDFSPSRLLFSNLLKGYISKLENYYLFIHNSGRVDSEDWRQECQQVEQEFQDIFDLTSTHQKLFSFVSDHQQQLIDALEEDEICKELSHPTKLQSVFDMMREK